MRLFVAALSFLIGLFVITGAFMALLPANAPEWLTVVGILTGSVLSLFITNRLVNVKGTNFWSLRRAPEPDERSEHEDLLVSTAYRANRCFEVGGPDEEGPHYFIELHDGSVLHMNGGYLAALGPRKILGLIDQPRQFPCTEFSVKRDRYDGCVADVRCGGTALEPEIVTPPFQEVDFQNNMIPHDGDILASRTYDEMKAAMSRKSGKRAG